MAAWRFEISFKVLRNVFRHQEKLMCNYLFIIILNSGRISTRGLDTKDRAQRGNHSKDSEVDQYSPNMVRSKQEEP